MKYVIATNILPEGIIEGTVDTEFEGVRTTLSRQIIETQDVQTREALIKLGWTPPVEDEEPSPPDYELDNLERYASDIQDIYEARDTITRLIEMLRNRGIL